MIISMIEVEKIPGWKTSPSKRLFFIINFCLVPQISGCCKQRNEKKTPANFQFFQMEFSPEKEKTGNQANRFYFDNCFSEGLVGENLSCRAEKLFSLPSPFLK